jgi:glycine betaine/proline transport system substrate-binding protein
MKKQILAVSLLAASTGAFAGAHGSCGSVQIADMNWASATLIANIDRFILENAFGCEAELVPGDTVPTSTSMIEKQQPDVAPELWTNSFKDGLAKGVEDGKLAVAGKVFSDGGEEGFWVPKYLVEKDPSLATIEGIKANPELFPHPEDDSKAGFMGCPAGWGCQINSANLFKALNLEDAGYELLDPGSAAGLDGSIARAYERGEGWFGYYWAPTAILGKYEMVKVDFGSGVDQEHFISCITQPDCQDPKPTMWPESPVYTYTTAELQQRAPEVVEYLGNRSFTNAQLNSLLAWMDENQADGEYAAENFMVEHADIWKAWLTDEQISKVESAL